MNVMDGTSFSQSDGTWLKVEIEVGDEDFNQQCAEWKVDPAGVGLIEKYQLLSALAQYFVLLRLSSARKFDEAWLKNDAPAMKEDVMGRLKTLKAKLTAS